MTIGVLGWDREAITRRFAKMSSGEPGELFEAAHWNPQQGNRLPRRTHSLPLNVR